LTALLGEIKKAVTFYVEKYKNELPITQLLLTGGGASLPGLPIYFAQNLGFEAVLANPWNMLNIQGVPHEIETKGPEYSTAVGLALKEYE
jgi:Tfp pilus assembly PilM family ATPase